MPHAGAAPPPWPTQPAAKQPRRAFLVPIGVALAVLLSAAALVVSLRNGTGDTSSTPRTQTAKTEPQQLFNDDADKPLCEAVGPLMKESNDVTNAFIATGAPGSPERSAAIPKFKADTLDLANRIEKVINEHADPPRYLTRTLQSYVDGMLLYSENMYPDRGADPFDKATYDSSVVAYGGPLATCYKLGVRW
jgi:hypothetical protein